MKLAPFCDQRGDGLLLSGFDASNPEWELKIPDKVGFPVGPEFGFNFLTLSLHVVNRKDSNWTGEVGLKLNIVPTNDVAARDMQAMGFLTLTVRGEIPPFSSKLVRGRFDVPTTMHPISSSIHYHRHGLTGRASRIKPDGEKVAIVYQDAVNPEKDVKNLNQSLHAGDKIELECLYRNDSPKVIRVL